MTFRLHTAYKMIEYLLYKGPFISLGQNIKFLVIIRRYLVIFSHSKFQMHQIKELNMELIIQLKPCDMIYILC